MFKQGSWDMDAAFLPDEVLENIVEAWEDFDATGHFPYRLDVHLLSGPVGLIDGIDQASFQFQF